MTYSKRTRELAAQLCSMAASNGMLVVSCAGHLGLHRRSRSRQLAVAAVLYAVKRVSSTHTTRYAYAEAEALIRTGWTP